MERSDIRAEYMPQNYEDQLDLSLTPVEYLNTTGDKEEMTRIRTYLGALKYTADEMDHPIRELSGGQKANFSPLSGPVIRQMLAAFPGAIISISHDRKYIMEVCEKVYRLETHGLVETNLQSEG